MTTPAASGVTAVEAIDGPVPNDHYSHQLRIDAAQDFVEKSKRLIAKAQARYPDRVPAAKAQLADAQATLDAVWQERAALGLPATPQALAESQLAEAQAQMANAQGRLAAVKKGN